MCIRLYYLANFIHKYFSIDTTEILNILLTENLSLQFLCSSSKIACKNLYVGVYSGVNDVCMFLYIHIGGIAKYEIQHKNTRIHLILLIV